MIEGIERAHQAGLTGDEALLEAFEENFRS